MTMTVADYLRLPNVPADRRLAYGPAPEQFGDLYLPAGRGPHPPLVLIHGGCWRARYTLAPVSGLARALAERGFAVWSLEYRRLGNGGGWPHTFRDAAAGADFLRGIAIEHDLDLSRAIAIGHSAGGHLALWLAGRHRLPPGNALAAGDPLPLRSVVSLAGIVDLAEGARRGLCGGACVEIAGGTPEQAPVNYGLASPLERMPLGVPQWHIGGRADPLVPADYLERCAAIASAHDETHLDLLEGQGHFELVVPGGPAWAALQRAARLSSPS